MIRHHRFLQNLYHLLHDRNISFDEFLRLAQLYRNHHWEQCVAHLPISQTDKGKELILDKVGITEKLDEDWEEIREALGINDDIEQRNSTQHIEDSSLTLSDIQKKEIQEMFCDDFEILKFER